MNAVVIPVTPVRPYTKGPYPTAARLLADGHLDGWTQRDGIFYQWTGRAYAQRTAKEFRQFLGGLLADTNVTYGFDWEPNTSKLNNVIDALVLPAVPDVPGPVLSLTNGLYDPTSGTLRAATSEVFITNHLPYAYDEGAACPEWLKFLESAWPDKPGCIELLQEWFGYLVSGSTAMQKAMLIIGPKRSGKGTILRTAESLLGQNNTGALKASNLSSWFGLQSVVGKSLAVIGDLRIDGRLSAAAAESLLSVTGEDIVNVQRKGAGLVPVDVRLTCRIMAGTNLRPTFADPGGALPTRFLYLPMVHSFFGKEDVGLGDRLAAELPGILNWSLAGWRRLQGHGRFTEPDESVALLTSAREDASPVGRFLDDVCRKDEDGWVASQALYALWKTWAREHGHPLLSDSTFLTQVVAQWPELVKKRSSTGSRPNGYQGLSLR